MNELATEIRTIRELAEAGRNRSPIEVVLLQGLTRAPAGTVTGPAIRGQTPVWRALRIQELNS